MNGQIINGERGKIVKKRISELIGKQLPKSVLETVNQINSMNSDVQVSTDTGLLCSFDSFYKFHS